MTQAHDFIRADLGRRCCADKPAPNGTGGSQVNDFGRAGEVDPRGKEGRGGRGREGKEGGRAGSADEVAQRRGQPFRMQDVPREDAATYAMIDRADTIHGRKAQVVE